jgi:adenylate cyclase
MQRNGITPKTGSRRRGGALKLLGVGCLVTLCVLLIQTLRPDLYEHMEHKVLDVLTGQLAPSPPGPVPILVAIADKSLGSLGQWPWPRHLLASLVSGLRQAGAEAVVLDLILASRDRTSLAFIREDLRQNRGLDLPLGHIPPELRDHDRALADALAQTRSVLGFKLLFEATAPLVRPCASGQALETSALPPPLTPHAAGNVICPLPELSVAASSLGFVNAMPDSDGVLRRVPIVAVLGDRVLPGLMLATLQARGLSAVGVGRDMDGDFVQFDRTRIRTDNRGNVLLRYRGPGGTFQTLSAIDVLQGRTPRLGGRIAIVGPTSAGLGDNQVTPMDRVFPGIEVHATLLDNILQGDHLARPSWSGGAEAMATLLVGALTSLLMLAAGPIVCAAGVAAGAVGIWAASLALLDGPGFWLSPLPAEMVLVLNMAVLSLVKYGLEERELRIRNHQLLQAQDATIISLTALAETRDPETGGHIKRTREYVHILARQLAEKPGYRDFLDSGSVELLYKSAPLHDIGKVGIADSILLKPGRLTQSEWLDMQRHTTIGAETLAEAESQAFDSADRSFLALARDIALTHHEKWDGTGYPAGLRGEEIPLGGRLMALADVYDALISKRVYKDAMTHAEAVEIIRQGSGTHFDPGVVEAFLETEGQFADTARRYG